MQLVASGGTLLYTSVAYVIVWFCLVVKHFYNYTSVAYVANGLVLSSGETLLYTSVAYVMVWFCLVVKHFYIQVSPM